jgi:serine protease Do
MNEVQNILGTVFKINSSTGTGSGFYLKKYGLFVTNHHVVYGAKKVAVESQKNEKYIANVVLVNPLNDIAFLRTETSFDLPDLQFKRHETVKNMDKVSVLGFPLGLPFTVTEGIVSSSKQILDGRVLIQTDAAVNPGNSGGPMVNSLGEVIGVTSSKISEAENMGFAIPIDFVIEDLDNFKNEKTAETDVKCPSCNQSISEKSEFCPNCGAKLDLENLFKEETKSELAQFVEVIFDELGIDPVIARVGPDYWEFHQGSALVRYFVYKNDYLFATSPMVKLPKTNLEAVYRYLLSNPGYPYSFSVNEGKIFISYRVHLTDIKGPNNKDIQKNLVLLAKKADELDNYLVEKFGCEFTENSKI